MRWSFRVARLLGIELRVHFTFLLLLMWIAGFQGSEGGWVSALEGVSLVLLIFLCVFLHELGHAAAALKIGIRTPDITLLPIGGIAHLERIPEKPGEEIFVALAGPVVSGVLAGFFFVLEAGIPGGWSWMSGVRGTLGTLSEINLGLLLFNLFPAFPMDGGRVLRAALASRMGVPRATVIAARVGQFLAVAMAVAGFLLPAHNLVLVAVFVFFSASREAEATALRSLSSRWRVADAMITVFRRLPDRASLSDAALLMQHSSQHDFPIVNGCGELLGVLTRNDLVRGFHTASGGEAALEFCRRDLPGLNADQTFDQALSLMEEHDASVLPVFEGSGALVGLFSREKAGELLLVQSAKHRGA